MNVDKILYFSLTKNNYMFVATIISIYIIVMQILRNSLGLFKENIRHCRGHKSYFIHWNFSYLYLLNYNNS